MKYASLSNCSLIRRRVITGAMAATAIGLTLGTVKTAYATSYPERAVTIVVAGPPAGGTDFLARLVADYLARDLKQSVVVENRAGASGLIGTKYVRQVEPDGYTFLMGHAATNAILPLVHTQKTYDPIKDFTPIGLIATAPEVLVVATDSPIKSVAEYVEYARKHPGNVSYGTPGLGQPQHILGERFMDATKTELLHIPYNGSGPALTDLVGGRLTSMFVTPGAVMPFVRDGRVRALAVSSPERSALLPDVPTLQESGIPGLAQLGWFALFAPAGLPQDRQKVVEAAIARVLANPEVTTKMTSSYVEPGNANAAEFSAFQASEVEGFRSIVNRLKITLNK